MDICPKLHANPSNTVVILSRYFLIAMVIHIRTADSSCSIHLASAGYVFMGHVRRHEYIFGVCDLKKQILNYINYTVDQLLVSKANIPG